MDIFSQEIGRQKFRAYRITRQNPFLRRTAGVRSNYDLGRTDWRRGWQIYDKTPICAHYHGYCKSVHLQFALPF